MSKFTQRHEHAKASAVRADVRFGLKASAKTAHDSGAVPLRGEPDGVADGRLIGRDEDARDVQAAQDLATGVPACTQCSTGWVRNFSSKMSSPTTSRDDVCDRQRGSAAYCEPASLESRTTDGPVATLQLDCREGPSARNSLLVRSRGRARRQLMPLASAASTFRPISRIFAFTSFTSTVISFRSCMTTRPWMMVDRTSLGLAA